MKKYFYALYLLLAGFPLVAQQVSVPQLINFAYSPTFYNGAYKAEQKGEMGILYSNQFLGLGSEGPSLFTANADFSPLIGIDNLGLGLRLLGDQTGGFIQSNNVMLDFAYNLIPEDDITLAIGVSAGFTSHRFKVPEGEMDANTFSQLALVDMGDTNGSQFEAGPSVYFKYKLGTGSSFQLGGALPKIFNSNVTFHEVLSYSLTPDWIGHASFRYQGDGFAVEPTLMARGNLNDRDCNCKTNIQASARGIFQVDDMDKAWAGLGYGLQGNINFGFGVFATEQLEIIGGVDYRPELGMSLEFGALYAIGDRDKTDSGSTGRDKTKTPKGKKTPLSQTEETTLLTNKSIVMSQMDGLNDIKSSAMVNLNLTEQLYEDARASNVGDVKRSKTSTAIEYLQQADEAIQQYKNKAAVVFDARKSTDDILNAHNLDKHKNAKDVIENGNKVNDDLRSLESRYNDLEKKVNSLAASLGLDKIDWKSKSNTYLISQLQGKLDKVANKPEDTAPVQVEGSGANAAIIYYFPFDSDSYTLNDLPAIKSITEHVSEIVAEMRSEGIIPQSIDIIGRLPIPKDGLIIPQSKTYDGSFSNILTIEYPFEDLINEETTDETMKLRKGDAINLGQLSTLQAYSIKDYLAKKGVFPKNLINLSLSAPDDIDYGLEIEIRINYLR